jgi:hypothetical protein
VPDDVTRVAYLTHRFVDLVPEQLEDGVLYVSIPFATAIHRCCCGCSREVVTPLTPTDWRVTFDGETVSLRPSIGNWGFPCRSHYWIERGEVRWARSMSPAAIADGRAADRAAKAAYYRRSTAPAVSGRSTQRWWQQLIRDPRQ